MTDETIGQRLRRLRLEAKLSQRDLSEPGVSYAYISRIEGGERTPSVKAIRKLARRLGVSAIYLETGVDPSVVEIEGAIYEVPEPVADLLAALRAVIHDGVLSSPVETNGVGH